MSFSILPPDLDSPAARSLSLLFILEEFLSTCTLIEELPPDALEKLLLSSPENPLMQKGGSLDKLCFYCDILLQTSEVDGETILMLLEQMRSCVLRLKESFQKEMQEKLCQFFTALYPFLLAARTNENILMHLLEKRERFNHFLGSRMIENLLQNLFPLGIEELRLIMSDGYARRGFEDFFASQESLIDALEWEMPCDPLFSRL